MPTFLKWLILGWSIVVVLLWVFLSFRHGQGDQVLFSNPEDLWGFMGIVFLTWIIPIAVFAFFAFLGRETKTNKGP